jgi:hypothetical protein
MKLKARERGRDMFLVLNIFLKANILLFSFTDYKGFLLIQGFKVQRGKDQLTRGLNVKLEKREPTVYNTSIF